MGLTPEQIQKLLAGPRRGGYREKLEEFIAGSEQGINVREQWAAEFNTPDEKTNEPRSATALKQGFENAKGSKNAPEGSDRVLVISSDGDVFLVKQSGDTAEAPAEAEAVAV